MVVGGGDRERMIVGMRYSMAMLHEDAWNNDELRDTLKKIEGSIFERLFHFGDILTKYMSNVATSVNYVVALF